MTAIARSTNTRKQGALLAFIFGYALTLLPLLKAMAVGPALKLALAADTASIAVMEIIDNAIMLVIPDALDAGFTTLLFWGSLAFSLAIAAVAAFPGEPLADCARQGSRGGARSPRVVTNRHKKQLIFATRNWMQGGARQNRRRIRPCV